MQQRRAGISALEGVRFGQFAGLTIDAKAGIRLRINRPPNRGNKRIMKVMVREVIAFGVAFAISLVISVAIVELIWGLI
jgi:hypothetical protein